MLVIRLRLISIQREPVRMARSTCQAMCINGLKIGIATLIIKVPHPRIQQARIQAQNECCVESRGTTSTARTTPTASKKVIMFDPPPVSRVFRRIPIPKLAFVVPLAHNNAVFCLHGLPYVAPFVGMVLATHYDEREGKMNLDNYSCTNVFLKDQPIPRKKRGIVS
jgi:hypothetical protein